MDVPAPHGSHCCPQPPHEPAEQQIAGDDVVIVLLATARRGGAMRDHLSAAHHRSPWTWHLPQFTHTDAGVRNQFPSETCHHPVGSLPSSEMPHRPPAIRRTRLLANSGQQRPTITHGVRPIPVPGAGVIGICCPAPGEGEVGSSRLRQELLQSVAS